MDALESSITDAQLNDWVRYYSVHPWGPDIEWYRTGTIAAMIANTAANRKPGSRMLKPDDFVPKPKAKAGKDFRQEFMAAFAGRIKKAKKNG